MSSAEQLSSHGASGGVTGAKAMAEDGALDGVEIMLCHACSGNVPAGHISCDAGPRMGARMFEIDVQGNPWRSSANDAGRRWLCNCSDRSSFQENLAPAEPAVVTVETLPVRWNVTQVPLGATGIIDAFSYDVLNKFPEYAEQVAKDTAKPWMHG